MLLELQLLTKTNTEDITQHIFELLKDVDKYTLKPLMKYVTDEVLKEEIMSVYNRKVSRHPLEKHNRGFSLEEFLSR